ncbi:hypothetical protein scyTo_0015698 [Scyliorhinus torazame]|uniref:Dynein heavy chain tail domain-containing protein n=1 Tax=Scyliorhinus torazame TaxID=75743 RepID=A0A401PX94_SCYTO|nr:hypothetical protein [Scyliorhinus torazame]
MHSNFDHRIIEVLREAKCIIKMGLEIPDIAKRLLKSEKALKSNHDLLEIESVLRQGVASLNWSATTLDQYFSDVGAATDELTALLKTITDLREMHIDLAVREIARHIIIKLPEDHSLTLEEVLRFNEGSQVQMSCPLIAASQSETSNSSVLSSLLGNRGFCQHYIHPDLGPRKDLDRDE